MIYVSSGCYKRTGRGIAVLQIMYDWHHSKIVLPYAVNRRTEFFNPAFNIGVFDPWASLCPRDNPFFNPSFTNISQIAPNKVNDENTSNQCFMMVLKAHRHENRHALPATATADVLINTRRIIQATLAAIHP